jgi:hypothetical protein
MPPENEFDPAEKGLAEEYLQHVLMNETRAYIERGRVFKSLSAEKVLDTWIAMFERWFGERTDRNGRDMDDAAAEIRLRGLEMPYDRVKEKTLALQAEVLRRGPEDDSPEIDRKIDDFLDARRKPKN